jgi:three-Cys-motif partner protein
VLRGYLDAWWPILLSANDEVTYAEGYAGPGEYQGGEDGSPVVALRALLQREHQPIPLSGKAARVVLVEERDDRLQHCVEQIHQRVGPLPSSVVVRTTSGRCETDLLRTLREAGAFGSPILVNLDPFATGIPYDVVREVAENRSSEVLISFMMQWFIRWADNEQLDHGDRMFGSTDWRQVADVPTENKRRWLIDRHRQRLHQAGFAHTVWFELVDEGGRTFALIFATASERGLLKMKESFWRVDPVRGLHFRDPRDPGQMAFDVGDDPYLAPLRNLLGEQMHGRSLVPVEELRRWTLAWIPGG